MGPLTLNALRLLADGHFHSGTEIARRLDRSRAALSESLKGARELGVEVFSVPGKGYRLARPIEFLDAHAIVSRLWPVASRVRLTLLDEVDSTSTHLASAAQAGAPSGTCVAAEWQRAGRGRRGRSWQAGLGASLTFSLLWRFEQGPGHLAGLSLAVAVAVVRALERAGVPGVGVKWPNDLVHDWKKLGGILVETSGETLGPSAAIIGIGINYRLGEALAGRIDQPATDVVSCGGAMPSRNALLAGLLAELVIALERFGRQGFAAFRDDWKARHVYAGRRVTVHAGDKPAQEAQVLDVADDGALVVAFGGRTARLTSAEISLRPL
ncbi:MAG TPA: biotin--[acetyl-CoA-carboxylase] ligase [Usitatibacteraceae bacterium]|nr:biotin--[acetyl-CoA-carboxylase] ligase [Usitatibacteraceae bacterium]